MRGAAGEVYGAERNRVSKPMPKTSSEKIARRELAALAMEGAA
jgi:acyl-coenzyme A synthetase/AMP-(fatty) acid ligase